MSACVNGITPARREAQLADALSAVQSQISRAATAAGRIPSEIELLPITKYFPATDVAILSRLGCQSFGESREQEASNKAAEYNALLGSQPIRWHMVGRIQRNKARSIAGWAYAAHSVDGLRVAAALDRAVRKAMEDGRRAEPLYVYVQLSLDGDTERGGVDAGRPELIDELCAAVDAAEGLQFVGLMAIPPLGSDPAKAFAQLAGERERLQRGYRQPLGLSAGMSSDLEIAVKHGSTCVRVGTALMGQRPLTSP